MTEHDRPSQVMDLMAAFGRRNKTSPTSTPAGLDTNLAASHEASGVKFEHAERLRANRLRSTVARVNILTVLENAAPQCLDAAELYRTLDLQAAHMAPATIYRALNDLWGAGLLIRNWSEHGRAHYGIKPDKQSPPVDTLECHCGKRLVLIEGQTLREHLRSFASEAGFDIEKEPAFTISMVCAGCRKSHQDGR
ncbi:transcriptional repressor [Pseudomonas extremaustralis]|uniref:Fur family transcriptional regulator n=1 Tax=Pseudomonas extremaustralis TaxID=359110 RepID=UPI00285B2BAA|nr:transcriptional repressor [Pseudomonas extremaustralis]MDR6575949.1 Fur family ferric uptake transcriptional regulator [Pseudomonas extremaustralis]